MIPAAMMSLTLGIPLDGGSLGGADALTGGDGQRHVGEDPAAGVADTDAVQAQHRSVSGRPQPVIHSPEGPPNFVQAELVEQRRRRRHICHI